MTRLQAHILVSVSLILALVGAGSGIALTRSAESGIAACTDAVDNDADGKIDYQIDEDCAAYVNVTSVLVNDNGGTATIADVPDPSMSATGDGTLLAGVPEGGLPVDQKGLSIGLLFSGIAITSDYAVIQGTLAGYGVTLTGACTGSAGISTDHTCTITYDDAAPNSVTPIIGTYAPACADGGDNDGDGRADYPRDLGCDSSVDTDEFGGVYPEEQPVSTSTIDVATSSGEVLGVATTTLDLSLPPSCTPYLSGVLKYNGKRNTPEEVSKLQRFLNEHMGAGMNVSGEFDRETRTWVKKYQVRYRDLILKPWIDAGYDERVLANGTGVVYLTTARAINLQQCASLDIPMPENLRPYIES
jgi:hypothetical protein